MFSILDHVGPELPLTLILLAALGFRMPVNAKTSLWINTSPTKLWDLLKIYDGKLEDWGNFKIRTELIDQETKTYRKTFSVISGSGAARQSDALFRVTQDEPEQLLELTRAGLEGKSENNELLKLIYQLSPENGGTRLATTYNWGPRALIAQLLGRADLWGGAFRMKAFAETGKPADWVYISLSIAMAMLTGLFSLAAFGMLMGFAFAVLLVIALFVHEFGHLLAYRMMGQPWGRILFLPFLGAIAMPRLPFESQGQSVFAALMGPGFSVILSFACALPFLWGDFNHPILAFAGLVTAGLNIFNMIPAEPLDGGIALRSILSRLVGARANYGLMAIGAAICAVGFAMSQVILVLFGGMAILANLKVRKIDHGLLPLSNLGLCIATFGYASITSVHFSLLRFFVKAIMSLQG